MIARLMTIRSAAQRVHMTPSGLRYHELVGRITPYRTEEGIRLYDMETLDAFLATREEERAARHAGKAPHVAGDEHGE